MPTSETPKRRLAAIMFSDICGFSRSMGQNEQRAMRILARHNLVVDSSIAQFDGAIIKRMGDGLLAEFHSASAAVECALHIQRRFGAENAEAPEDERFQVRIGVHLGDVLVAGDDILGDGVNVASRIEPLALPGGICISQDVYNQVVNKVEIETVALGPQQLKNIQRQIEIYRVLIEAADKDKQPPPIPVAVAPTPSVSPPPPPPHKKEKRPWSRRKKIIVFTGVLLFILALTADRNRRGHEDDLISRALEQEQKYVDAGDLPRAIETLERVVREVRPNRAGMKKVLHQLDKRKAALEEEENKAAVEEENSETPREQVRVRSRPKPPNGRVKPQSSRPPKR